MSQPVSPVSPNLLPAWDEAAAVEAIGGDPAVARDLLAQLRAGLPDVAAGLQAHAAAGDWRAVLELAHRCAGGAAYCGVPALSAALCDLERVVLAQAGGPGADAALAQVVREIDRLLALTL